MGYRPEIDGLRAVAVLPVILFHAGFGVFSGGYVGVDVFFVISGYLITGILLREIDQGRFSLLGFYERRARRILPALFAVMALCVPFAWLWMAPTQFKEFGQSLAATSLFGSNVLFWQQSDYFARAAEERPLLHTWSLAVEEQFYLLFPVFLLVSLRFSRSLAFWSIVLIAAMSLALSEYAAHNHPRMNFFLAPMRAWELLAGSLCAFALHRWEQTPSDALAWLGLGLIVSAVFAFDDATPFPSVYALVPVLGTVLIILFARPGSGSGMFLATPVLVGIGLISYSAYLWHQPLFAFARIYSMGEPERWVMMMLSGLALALAYFSWRCIELPFRRRSGAAWLASRTKLFAASGAVSAAFVAFGAYAHLTGGLPWRFPMNELRASYLKTMVASPYRDACHRSEPPYIHPEDACVYFGDEAQIAVMGDSHAVELAYSLGEALEPDGISVLHLSAGACRLAFGQAVQTACGRWPHQAVDRVLADDQIETVIVVYRIYAALFGMHEGVYPELPDSVSEVRRRATLASYLSMVTTLAESDKKVVLVLQSPELPRHIEDLILRSGGSGEDIVGVPRDWWEARRANLRDQLEVPASVTVVEPTELFCDDDFCYAGRDGVSYYYDDDHLSPSGARLVANQILDALSDVPGAP